MLIAVEGAADDLGVPTRRVATEADEAGVDLLLAIGFPHYYPDLLRRPRRARRILWCGEPLPSGSGYPASSSRLRAFTGSTGNENASGAEAHEIGGSRPADRPARPRRR